MFAWFSDLTASERRTIPCNGGLLATKLGLTVAIAIFSLSAYGIMIVALLMLPETRGRSLLSLEQTAAE